MSDEPIEAWMNHEREFRIYSDKVYKRNLRPDDYRVYGKRTYVPPLGLERLRNEAACLAFVRSKTAIPVPRILEAFNDGESFVLVTQRLSGVKMNELSLEDQVVVMKEVETHINTLRTLRSDRTGGPSGIVCPPNRVTRYFPSGTTWPAIVTAEKGFVFCHCDLSQSNIIVNPETLKIEGIIDWEYGGFWPDFFETPYFRDPRPSGAQFKNMSENALLVEFLQGQTRLGKETSEQSIDCTSSQG